MPSPADLATQGAALELLLAGIHPALQDTSVLALGNPPCLPAILLRPIAGESTVQGSGGCTCETRWGAYLLAPIEGCLEDAQALVYELASNCGERSVPARLKPNRKLPTPLRVRATEEDDAELVSIGAAIHAVEPAASFGLVQFNTEGPPNAYGAVVPIVIRYDCCT